MTQQFTRWLRELPANSELAWHSPQFSAQRPWAGGMVDVCLELFAPRKLDSCGITFITPLSNLRRESDMFPLRGDLDLHAVYDHKSGKFTVVIPLAKDIAPTPEQEWILERAASVESCQRGVCEGWSPAKITFGLQTWSSWHAGRSDFSWRWDEHWALPDTLQALVAANIARRQQRLSPKNNEQRNPFIL